MDAHRPVRGVGMVHHVVGAVAGSDDRRVVYRVRPGDPYKWGVARAGHRARLELGQREPVRPRYRDTRGAEVRRARKADGGRPEMVLRGWQVDQVDCLYARRAGNGHVGQLRREIHAQVVRCARGGRVLQDVPHLLGMGRTGVGDPGVDGEPHVLLAEVDLDGAWQGQVAGGQYAAELAEPRGLSRDRTLGHR